MPSRPLVNLIEAVPSDSVLKDIDSLYYFEDSLSALFADARNQHGEPGEMVVYKSEVYFGKDLKLRLANPKKEDNGLFAHFLWNVGTATFGMEMATCLMHAGVQAAEMIASEEWNVKGETVLELGAGAGLPSIVAGLCGAKEVVISDYPAPELLSNISANVKRNVTPQMIQNSKISVRGHKWGELDPAKNDAPVSTVDLLTTTHSPHRFTRIIVADCMWMAWQHKNLCSSIAHFLDPEHGEILAIAGFHTGRSKVVNFFKECERVGLVLLGEGIVEKNVDGGQRGWCEDRDIEDVVERKRWLTIGKLKMDKVLNGAENQKITNRHELTA
ncbi:hypothetical protein EV426DRAFT_709004 [Tirmania nivea]|nr:hypothetical protein EV426DRAFT_709004 [Tirmania nivea]